MENKLPGHPAFCWPMANGEVGNAYRPGMTPAWIGKAPTNVLIVVQAELEAYVESEKLVAVQTEQQRILKIIKECRDNAASSNDDWNNGYLEGKKDLINELKAEIPEK